MHRVPKPRLCWPAAPCAPNLVHLQSAATGPWLPLSSWAQLLKRVQADWQGSPVTHRQGLQEGVTMTTALSQGVEGAPEFTGHPDIIPELAMLGLGPLGSTRWHTPPPTVCWVRAGWG